MSISERMLAPAVAALTAMALAVPTATARSAGKLESSERIHRIALRGGIRVNGARLGAGPKGTAASWMSIQSLKQAVQEIGGAAFAGGKLYLPGGYISLQPSVLSDKMQIYNPRNDKWTRDSEPMPANPGGGWADSGVCTDGTKVYVVNGVDGNYFYSTLQVFDPAAPAGSRWTMGPNPNVGGKNFYSQDSGCSWIHGKMYVYGGYGLVDGDQGPAISRLTWVYDPVAGNWSDTQLRMKVGRLWFGYTSNRGFAYVAGGTSNLTDPVASVERFKPGAGWKRFPDLPLARLAPGAGFLGTSLAVFGGSDDKGANLASTLTCASPCASWANAHKNLVTPRSFFGFAYDPRKATLYAAGGSTGSPDFVSIQSAEKTT